MHSTSTTDLSILYTNLNESTSFNKENVVLIQSGAFNPIHRAHISNMIKTKEYLERVHGFRVIGGYLSPSHDQYVQAKLDDEFISGHHRIRMCEEAIKEASQEHWLIVDKAEIMGKKNSF
jgi:nicotinamide mononucleotide adenylyltransferase